MTHVRPHRWADLADGRVGPAERRALERHAEACAGCARARERVLQTRRGFEAVRDLEPPELRWDHIRARIHWFAASRAGEARSGRRRAAIAGAALALAGGAALAVVTSGGPNSAPAERASNAGAPASAAGGVEPPPGVGPARPEPHRSPAPLAGVVTFTAGEVTVNGRALAMDAPIGPGARLTTGDGRVAVQFGPGTGFELGPRSTATLTAFDDRRVELAVSGTIDVEVAERAPDQRFAVVAGGRRVEVRGTAFRVGHRGGALEVTCTRGRVVVKPEANAALEPIAVGAGRSADISRGDAAATARPIAPGKLADLEREVAVRLLPAWTDDAAILATSATLEVRAEPNRTVRVDGAPAGRGTFRVRVMPGRHHVGSGRSGGWVDVEAGARERARVGPARGHRGARAARARQLDRALAGNPAVDRCLRPLAKRGLRAGSVAVFDIGVNRDGAQGHLNIVRSNVPRSVSHCLREVLDDVSFPPGPRATIRKRLAF